MNYKEGPDYLKSIFSKLNIRDVLDALYTQSLINFQSENPESYIAQQFLIESSFYALKYCSNLSESTPPSKEELLKIVNSVQHVENKNLEENFNENRDMAMSTIANNLYQIASIEESTKNFIRMFYIASSIDMPENVSINFIEAIKKADGLEIQDLLFIMFAFNALAVRNIIKINKRYIKEKFITDEALSNKFIKYLDKRSIPFENKDEFINLDNWNILRFYPFIKFGDDYLLTNVYSLLNVMSLAIYWDARDYFKINYKGKFNFPSRFGYYFEQYIINITKYYLGEKSIHKIKEGNARTPDFFLEVGDYTYIIEAKSSLMSINTLDSSNENWKDDSKRFVETTIEKASKQLFLYEDSSIKNRINVILTFDDIYASYLFENKYQSPNNKFIIISIHDFENLLEGEYYKKGYINKIFSLKLGLGTNNKDLRSVMLENFEQKYNENKFLHEFYIKQVPFLKGKVENIKSYNISTEKFLNNLWYY